MIKRDSVLETYDMIDLLELTKISNTRQATTLKDTGTKYRKTLRYDVDHRMFPELCERIENIVNDGTKVNQFDLLLYNKGYFYKKHTDVLKDPRRRIWTSITMIDKQDLTGGELVVYLDDDEVVIDLDIGETVVFKSSYMHEAKEVLNGSRLVLVAWLISA